MEQIVIDGVRYEKATKLAKDFRYTTDYIGQLCRSGKVDAKLVGRSWFVNPDTLKQHKQNRYQKGGDEITFNNKGSSSDEKSNTDGKPKHFLSKIVWNPVSYETDDTELLPKLQKSDQAEATKLSVRPAEASDLEVAGKDEESETFSPTPLPEVSLTGTLKVESLDSYFDPDEGEDSLPPRKTVQLRNQGGAMGMRRKKGLKPPVQKKPVSGAHSDISFSRDNKQINGFLDKISEKGEEIDRRKKMISKARHSLQKQESGDNERFSPARVTASSEPKRRSSFLLVHISILLSAAIIVLMMSLDSRVVSDGASASTSLEFSFENLRDAFTNW